MRKSITLDVGGVYLRGTFHWSTDEVSDAAHGSEQGNRIGILFLNSGFLPRAAYADSAVYWADAFARCGYPSFRIDLPGVGDSEGEVPVRMLDLVHNINDGHYGALLSGCVKHLIERFNLWGVVLVGLCAGAVSAIYAAAASTWVKGLVVLDPYFNVQREQTSWQKVRFSLPDLLNRWSTFDHNTSCRLPKNANMPLLRCWKRLTSLGTPILALKARVSEVCRNQQGAVEFDYLRYLQTVSDRQSHTTLVYIEGANHSFADGIGKPAVERHVVQWLNQHFPLNVGTLAKVTPEATRAGAD